MNGSLRIFNGKICKLPMFAVCIFYYRDRTAYHTTDTEPYRHCGDRRLICEAEEKRHQLSRAMPIP